MIKKQISVYLKQNILNISGVDKFNGEYSMNPEIAIAPEGFKLPSSPANPRKVARISMNFK
jgi:hypothetical protein